MDSGKDNSRDIFENMLRICPKLQSLNFFIKKVSLRTKYGLQEVVLVNIRRKNMTTNDIASWAVRISQVMTSTREEIIRIVYEGFQYSKLENFGSS